MNAAAGSKVEETWASLPCLGNGVLQLDCTRTPLMRAGRALPDRRGLDASLLQELFKKVVPYHCLGCIWSQRDKKGKEHLAPSIRATVSQFNSVTNCVIATCLGDRTLKPQQRAKVVERWVEVARVSRWAPRVMGGGRAQPHCHLLRVSSGGCGSDEREEKPAKQHQCLGVELHLWHNSLAPFLRAAPNSHPLSPPGCRNAGS